jgi:exopolyphosphatase/guanosine-5'-triphosphate,3'-diphosphate pyrophosphatase
VNPASTRVASIDLGTNTALLLVAEKSTRSAGAWETIEDHSTVVRLGQGVDETRMLQPEAMARTLACLKKYSEIVRRLRLRPEDTIAVATSQARDARNAADFFKQVQSETGFVFRTLTGDQEAAATFEGALLPDTPAATAVVIDIGGGSTEFKSLTEGGLSVDLGSVRFTERYLKTSREVAVTDEQFWTCRDAVDAALAPVLTWWESVPAEKRSRMGFLAVAGTATTLAQWFLAAPTFDRDAIDRVEMTVGDVHRMVEELKWRSPLERERDLAIDGGRADVLLAGAMILWRALTLLGVPSCRVSTRGLRYGILSINASSR